MTLAAITLIRWLVYAALPWLVACDLARDDV